MTTNLCQPDAILWEGNVHDALISPEDVDDFVILRAKAFTGKVHRIISRDVLQNEDLPVLEWRLLFSLARFGSCHLAYITRHTSIDPAHGSRAVSALEKKGLISRRSDPDNRRRKLISLTPSGLVVFQRIWPRARGTIRSISTKMKREDFDELKRLLDLLNDAADPLLENAVARQNRADPKPQETALATHT